MSSNVYARIAERYQVLASDDEAVDRFFLDVAPRLPREERAAIVAELRDEEGAASPRSETTDLPTDVPIFSIQEAPPVARPNSLAQLVGELSAEVERRVSDRLDMIADAVERLHEDVGLLKLASLRRVDASSDNPSREAGVPDRANHGNEG